MVKQGFRPIMPDHWYILAAIAKMNFFDIADSRRLSYNHQITETLVAEAKGNGTISHRKKQEPNCNY